MFKIDDYVMYGSTGVCKITDIAKDEYHDTDETMYYILQPVYNDNLTIKIPVDNTNIPMRAIITKEEVLSLIKAMPEKETIWIDDNRERNHLYKAILKKGSYEELIRLIKTLYLEKEEKSVEGKTLTKTDENIMNNAERLLYEEFAIALGISPDQVLSYIIDNIPRNK